jgi:methanogenic corrinoid protein MtbC1
MIDMREQTMAAQEWTGVRPALHGRRAHRGPDSTPLKMAKPIAAPSVALSALAAAIRNEVLPRLVLAQRAMTAAATPLVADVPVWSDAVVELSQLVMRQDAGSASEFVKAMIENGTSLHTVYLDVLAGTARRLGALWADDVNDIAEVTLGVWRLHDVMRGLRPIFLAEGASGDSGRPVLLLPAPGETHTFGLAMVDDFFTRAGWNVSGGPATAGADLGAQVEDSWFAVVGFSVGCDASLDALAAGIRTVRRRSRNRAVGIMVGGPVFALNPELAVRVGADATAADGLQAVVQADSLVRLLGARK